MAAIRQSLIQPQLDERSRYPDAFKSGIADSTRQAGRQLNQPFLFALVNIQNVCMTDGAQ